MPEPRPLHLPSLTLDVPFGPTAPSGSRIFAGLVPLAARTLDAPEQYRLPSVCWTAATHADPYRPVVACDRAWSVLASQSPVRLTGSGLAVGQVPALGIPATGC